MKLWMLWTDLLKNTAYIYSVLDWRYSFWVNLVQKFKIISLGWNLVPRLFEYAKVNGVVRSFRFRPETPFLNKFGPKNQNCQFELKFGNYTNSNMQNSMMVFAFPVLTGNSHFRQIWSQNLKLFVWSEIFID